MDEAKRKAWAGVDAGKEFHWAVVLDAQGEVLLLSRRVENEERPTSRRSSKKRSASVSS